MEIVEQIVEEFKQDTEANCRRPNKKFKRNIKANPVSFKWRDIDNSIQFIKSQEVVMYIGIGLFNEYVDKITYLFKHGVNTIKLRAHRRITAKAIDIAEIVKQTIKDKVRTKELIINSRYADKGGSKIRYSTIEITLTRCS